MERNSFIIERERTILDSSTSLAEKAKALEALFIYWDYELEESQKDFEAKILDPRIMQAMESLWASYYKYTGKGMHWSGDVLDSVLLPDTKVIPANKNYSNIDGLTWGEIMAKYNFFGLEYHRGKPDFATVALHTVEVADLDRFIVAGSNDSRGPLQEFAFRVLADRLGQPVEDVRRFEEENRLVWHEDSDCMTLHLVPQEIHNNLQHFGGIAMHKVLRTCGLA